MAKILIIEPHKLLQQAIALALFPEHEVRVEAAANAVAIDQAQGVDLIILDAGALRDRGQLSAEVLRAAQQAAVPILWLDDDATARPPQRDKLELVAKPIERDALQAALVALISGAAPVPQRRKARAGSEARAAETRARRKKQADDAKQPDMPLIDLVEVVAEEPLSVEQPKSPVESK